VNVVGFLAHGVAWGLAGLAVLQLEGSQVSSWVVAVLWLAGLACINLIRSRGTRRNAANLGWSWAFMAAGFVVLVAVRFSL